MAENWKEAQARRFQEQNKPKGDQHKKEQHKDEQHEQRREKGRGDRKPNFLTQNQIVYNLRVAWRYLTSLLKESFLAAVFVTPFYLWFHYAGIQTVTLHTDFMNLWVIGLMVFLLQNSMFRKGG